MKLTSSNIYALSLYRAPFADPSQFLDRSDDLLKALYLTNSEYINCGDFNTNYFTGNWKKYLLNSLLLSCNLIGTVDFPTRLNK